LLLNPERKHAGVLCLAGLHRVELGTKQAIHNSCNHHLFQLCLRRTMRSGSQLRRRRDLHPGTIQLGITPRNHTRLEGRDGRQLMIQHGRDRLIPLTLGDYHHLSTHDSLFQTIMGWIASTLDSEGWISAQVRSKTCLTLTCKI
jgi:hypothetical protein